MTINKATADFTSSLTTDELEILAGLTLGQNKNQNALEWRLYCMLELVDRFDTGRNKTGLDIRKADKWRREAKMLIDEHRGLLPPPPSDDFFACETLDLETGLTKNFWSTDIFYTVFLYYTRLRLGFHRGNKILLNFSKGVPTVSYVYLGFAGIVELIVESVALALAVFAKTRNERHPEYNSSAKWEEYKVSLLDPETRKAALANEKKENRQPLSKWQRFLNAWDNGTSYIRTINAAAWFVLNVICFIISGFTLPVAILTIAGTVMDIILDTGSASYTLKNHVSLSKKLSTNDRNTHLIDPSLRNEAQEKISPKTENASITRVLRLFNYNAILSLAMVFMLAYPPGWLAIALFGFITLVSGVELINFKLPTQGLDTPEKKKNLVDKIRVLVVLGIVAGALALTILAVMFPPAALAFTLPLLGASTISYGLIGASVALIVGLPGLIRAITFAAIDGKWTKERFLLIHEKVLKPIGLFFKTLFGSNEVVRPDVQLVGEVPSDAELLNGYENFEMTMTSWPDLIKFDFSAPVPTSSSPPAQGEQRRTSKSTPTPTSVSADSLLATSAHNLLTNSLFKTAAAHNDAPQDSPINIDKFKTGGGEARLQSPLTAPVPIIPTL